MTARQTLGRELKRWREKAGLTQREVAKALGFTSSQYPSNWERGVSKPPLKHLPALCDMIKAPRTKLTRLVHRADLEAVDNRKKRMRRIFEESRDC